MRLMEEGHVVTAVDNLSRGNYGSIKALRKLSCGPTCFKFINIDLGQPFHVKEVRLGIISKLEKGFRMDISV